MTEKQIKFALVILLCAYLFTLCFMIKESVATEFLYDFEKYDIKSPDNYFSVEFDQAPLSDILFFVAEQTGKAFVLDAPDTKLSWVQTNIFRAELYKEFRNIVSSAGLIIQESGRNNKITVISSEPKAISSISNSVAYYKLKFLNTDSLQDTSEILYKNRLAINPLPDTKVVLLSGDPQDVKQFIELIQSADTPKETDLMVYRLKNVSVKTARIALIEIGVFEDNSFYPDYWNRSIVVRGDQYQQSIAQLLLSAIDVPYEGIVDSMQFVTTVTPEAAIEILQGVYNSVIVRKVAEDRILLSGESNQVEKAIVLLNKIDGAGLQVKIEAVVAYLTDREYRKLGIKYNYIADTGRYFTLTESATGTTIGLLADEFEALLSWSVEAEDNISHGSIISSPVLTVLNGKSARLHVGQNVPYISEANVDKNDGSTTGTSIKRQDVGVTFNVTPVISPDGQFVTVQLDQVISAISPESEVENHFQDIVLDKQELSSNVKIADGQTIFLGGLSVDEEGNYTEKIPLLGDIPIIGKYLFSYTADTVEKRNLVVSLRVKVIGG